MSKYMAWLKKQQRRDDPIGDFARDAIYVLKHPAAWGGTQPNESSDLREWCWAFSGAWDLVQRSMVNSFLEYYGEVGFPRWYKKLDLYENQNADLLLSAIWDAIEDSGRSSVSLRTRFLIFRRDNYQCQICGRSAQDGVILEVDHKIPVAANGNGDLKNLWVLCFECNRGKAALSLEEEE